jgi:chorismate dehydratase
VQGNQNILRIASVSYLNARPLIEGLLEDEEVRLALEVPSRLLELMREDAADVALLPVIDYQRMEGLTIIPAGGIGSDGATLTVRVFSRAAVEKIQTVACDTDSHTSVALARVILSRAYGLRPEFVKLAAAGERSDEPTEARLLIGDKVVCEEPQGFEVQLDLGAEWKKLTGLPFVFATWMARGGVDMAWAQAVLQRAKQRGLGRIDDIIERHAVPRGWPAELARQYLTENLKFDVGARELEAIELFHRMAAEEGVIGNSFPLKVWEHAKG